MFEQRKARDAWANGARAILHGTHAARPHFERALSLDDGMADAWLGLHATDHRHEEAVAQMARHEQRFGDERRRQGLALKSRFQIGYYVTHRLETHFDLWCAVAAGHIDRDEHDLAEAALQRVSADAPAAAFLRGHNAFASGDDEMAIVHFRQVIGSDEGALEAESRLLSGILLAREGVIGPAKEHLNWVLKHDHIPADPLARYYLGLTARAEGNEAAAMRQFHLAYAEDPTIDGLKEAMAENPNTVRVSAPESSGRRVDDRAPDEQQVTAEPAETVEDVLADLNKQVGQPALKRQVEELVAHTRHQMHRREAGLKESRLTEHFVFTGPPGTGKTTIARVIARLYKALGILDGGHVVEVDKSDLVGEYLGQTPQKTKAKLDEAIGGVLFVDEAYALSTEGFNKGDAFGQEAIDTLLKRMEDDRDSLVVIAAGYPDEMKRFIASNPGLRSRFTTTIDFTPYTVEDLVQIAQIMAAETGDTLTPDAIDIMRGGLTHLHDRGAFESPDFGNARFVRNLIEKAVRKRSHRLSALPGSPDVTALTELTGDDIRAAGTDLANDLRETGGNRPPAAAPRPTRNPTRPTNGGGGHGNQT